MGNIGFWEVLSGKGPRHTQESLWEGTGHDILGNSSKGSWLLPRQELRNGEFETKEKVLLKNCHEVQPETGACGPGYGGLERFPTSAQLRSEPRWADGGTARMSAEWWGCTRWPEGLIIQSKDQGFSSLSQCGCHRTEGS